MTEVTVGMIDRALASMYPERHNRVVRGADAPEWTSESRARMAAALHAALNPPRQTMTTEVHAATLKELAEKATK